MRLPNAVASLAAVAVVSGLIASCSGGIANTSSGGSADGSCIDEGQRRSNGEKFPKECNTCTCEDGRVSCTLIACGSTRCQYNGSEYLTGASFPSTDGCNTCTCANGSVGCTKKGCVADAGSSDANDGGDAGYTCPPDGTIDCQPVVPPRNAAFCSAPYRSWIEANCPGVTFVD